MDLLLAFLTATLLTELIIMAKLSALNGRLTTLETGIDILIARGNPDPDLPADADAKLTELETKVAAATAPTPTP